MEPVETRYAKSGDLSIAYTDRGEGAPVVWVPGFISHVELNMETPFYEYTMDRMSRAGRILTFDKRGTGLSDREMGFGTLEERMDDVRAVMDAAGVERASLVGVSEGGPLCIMFAATYPERVDKLVLYGTFPRMMQSDDYPDGVPERILERLIAAIEAEWGTGTMLPFFVHQIPEDDQTRAQIARFERYTATPHLAAEIMRFNCQLDVRPLLGSITAPTLVLHCIDDPLVRLVHAQYLAAHIPDATYVEIPGDFHVSWLVENQRRVLDAMEAHLHGRVTEPEPTERILTTVLFTDIVASTERATQLGDAQWRGLLDRHDAVVRAEIERHRGREVNTTGDGFLASFDGPARAVRCAQAITQRTHEIGVDVRAGVHTGECELRGDDLAGIAVHVGARVMSLADAGTVLVTRTVRDLVAGSGISFEARGEHRLKGIDDEIAVFAAVA